MLHHYFALKEDRSDINEKMEYTFSITHTSMRPIH